MPDYYSTAVLGRVIQGLKRPQRFLLDTFFPYLIEFDTEEVVFDYEESARRALPYVSPLVEGQIWRMNGFESKSFKPAYLKPKSSPDPRKSLKRRAGESIGSGDLSPEQRLQAAIAQVLQEHIDGVSFRKEQMAGELLSTGKLIIDGKDYPRSELDFGRDAGNTINQSGVTRWGESGISPVDDITADRKAILKATGAAVTDIVFEPSAFELFTADPKFEKLINKDFMGNQSSVEQSVAIVEGGELQGKLGAGGPNLWTYSGWWVDPEDGVEKEILPEYSVVLGSRAEAALGSQLHGAIIDDDLNAAGQPTRGEIIPKAWSEKDPGRMMIMSQSAPLVAPGNPNTTRYRKVR